MVTVDVTMLMVEEQCPVVTGQWSISDSHSVIISLL